MSFLEGLIYMMWRGIAIGVIISAPMGPVGVLCVQRTLERGRLTGFFTGVGAAVSDLFYCLLTGFGLSFIEEFLKANQNVIQIIGSVVLVIFGIYLFRSNPTRTLKKPDSKRISKRMTMLSGFLFTVSNPLIIFLIIGLFARFNFLLPEITVYQYIVGFVFIIVGALLWWWLVTFFVDKVRAHFNLRSMWLVNKITGVIIMIFAVVGVITAFTGSAEAASPTELHFNSERGFGSLATSDALPGEPLIIENNSSDTITAFLPLHAAEDFYFSFRIANLNNVSGKKYPYSVIDPSGKPKQNKSEHPAWGIALKKRGGEMRLFGIQTIENSFDELLPVQLCASYRLENGEQRQSALTSGVDLFTGQNCFTLARVGDEYLLNSGNRKLQRMLAVVDSFKGDSIGFVVTPGGRISLNHINLSIAGTVAPALRSHFSIPDALKSYLLHSTDPLEGVWELFDYQIDEKYLRLGGSYRVAIAAVGGGYELVYLKGAQKNPDAWSAGMKKGELKATPYKKIFDVVWYDPAFNPIAGDVKAQEESSGLLTIRFPAHDSWIRLRKILNP